MIAEQFFASGFALLLSITSAGQITDNGPAPYFVLIDRALRDEETSYHYLPPAMFANAPDETLLSLVEVAGFVRYRRREKNGGEQSQVTPSPSKSGEPQKIPFVHRLTCTIDEAYDATGLGRTKLYELIGAGHLVTTTVGRRRLVVVRSLLSLLEVNMST